jgi:hypothetical protein
MNYNIHYELAKQIHADRIREAENDRLARLAGQKQETNLVPVLKRTWFKLTKPLSLRQPIPQTSACECSTAPC